MKDTCLKFWISQLLWSDHYTLYTCIKYHSVFHKCGHIMNYEVSTENKMKLIHFRFERASSTKKYKIAHY